MMMPQPTTTSAAEEEEKVRTLWIGDLEPWMSENYIYLCFEPTREVFTSRVIRDDKTGKSECFGFIQFETHAIADRILHKFNGAPMPMVIGSLFTLNWAVSDIFTTTSDTTNYLEEEEEEEEEAEVGITNYDGQCGIECRFCPAFPRIPVSTVVEEAKPGSSYWEDVMKSWTGDSDKISFIASLALRMKATADQRAADAADRRAAARAAMRILSGAPQEPQTVVDVPQRVHQIARIIKCLGKRGVNTIEDLLDELKGYVKSIDVAKELHSIDALSDILLKLTYADVELWAGFRAKVAELVTAMVHNNPRGQQLVMEVDGLGHLFHSFISGFDATARTNAFYAISSLIWNNKPGITEFRRLNGYVELRDALLSSVSVAFQRKALNLIQHLLHENSSDYNIVTELGFPSIMMYLLAFSDDAEVREAALECLLVLARVEEGENSGHLVKNDDKLKQVLQGLRVKGISAMAPEDLGAARKERQLVDSLWNACYNEPSSFREKGLLVLPGEDAPMSDVASKLFEPPLRACDAVEAVDRNSNGEKIETLLVKRRKLHFSCEEQQK